MPRKQNLGLLVLTRVHQTILLLRGQRVILDADLARLYGVTTKRLNQQVARNIDRFPEDFMFQLTAVELDFLRSQFATSNPVPNPKSHDFGLNSAEFPESLRLQFATSKTKGGRRYRPYAFTEHGGFQTELATPKPLSKTAKRPQRKTAP